MTFDHSKLKGKMREEGFTQESLSSRVGISETSLWNKLNGKQDFTSREMLSIMTVLGIEDPKAYFFTLAVGKSQP